MAGEQKVKVPLPTGGTVDGVQVGIEETIERWSDVTLTDGTVLRIKATPVGVVRLEGQYDPQGNPMYVVNIAPLTAVASAPDKLKRKLQ